jgi:GNAT superfamily N-acetyltransferase
MDSMADRRQHDACAMSVKPLKELTIPGFLMKGYFEDCLDAGRGRVIIAFDSLRPIGWCLLTPFGCTRAEEGKLLAAFFVHEDYRWQGIGKTLSDMAREGDEPVVFRASDRNRGFFEAVGMLPPKLSTVAP